MTEQPTHPVNGHDLIAAERLRQVDEEGYTSEQDQLNGASTLRLAARAYVYGDIRRWPWAPEFWKPKDRLSDLIRAGALFQAARDVQEETSGPVSIPDGELNRCAYEIDALLDKARSLL